MIAHIVLFKPRPDLSTADRESVIAAMRVAFTTIPEIRRVRVGRRRILGRSYDAYSQVDFEYSAILEFETEDALQKYLDHPAHIELGQRFGETAEAALVYDFAIVELEEIQKLIS